MNEDWMLPPDEQRELDIMEQHESHVHVNCDPDECPKAGTVESLHSHGFDGPLVCGCEELGG